MNTQCKFLLGVALCTAVITPARAAEPVLGKSPRYCNPLPMVSGGGASASGDVTMIRDNGAFYMCGNDEPLLKADHPLGPFTNIGNWQNTPGVSGGWNGEFRRSMFVSLAPPLLNASLTTSQILMRPL